MGLLGVSLLFVGIVLISNGVGILNKTDPKSLSFMNIIAGSVLIVGNIIALAKASVTIHYLNAGSGLLFGFTYIFVAFNMLKNPDRRPFGWFSACVAVFAVIMGIISFVDGGIWMGLLWTMWAVLWLEGFLEIVCKFSKLGRIYPYLAIFEGIFAAFVPAILMLLEVWPV